MCNRLRRNSNSTDESRSLKTPSPPIDFYDDVNTRAEQNSTNDLSSTVSILELFTDPPTFLSDAQLDQLFDEIRSDNQQPRTDVGTMIADIEGLKKSIRRQNKLIKRLERMFRQNQAAAAENKTILQQHGVLLERILFMLERQTPSNPQTTETISRFARSDDSTFSNNDLTSAVGLSIDERSTTSQGSSIEILGPTQNLIRGSLPSFSRPRETIELPTTRSTAPKSSTELLCSNINQMKPMYPEKNRGKIPLSQWCHEIYVGTTDDVPALLAPTNPKSQIPTEQDSINYQLSRQLTTTIIPNPSIIPKNESIKIGLLHPLQIKLPHQTDRHDTVLDCYGNTPVLLVFGDNLPTSILLQIAAVSNSSNGRFFGAFRFHKLKDQCDNFDSRVLQKLKVPPQRFEIHQLKLHKKCYGKLQDEKTGTFKLKPYPSGDEIDTNVTQLQTVLTKYGLKQIQLAFQIADHVLYSNVLSTSMEAPKEYSLRVLRQPSNNNALSFDGGIQCPMKFTLEIPEPFHCTLPSGWKSIEMAVVFNGVINPLYYIDTGNGEQRNPNYVNVDKSPLNLSFKIVKKMACELRFDEEGENAFEDRFEKQTERSMSSDTPNGDVESILDRLLSKFQIRFRLIHSETKPDCESKGFEDECKPVLTNEYIEGLCGTSICQEETSRKTGQKRSSEVLVDDSNEMTTSKRS